MEGLIRPRGVLRAPLGLVVLVLFAMLAHAPRARANCLRDLVATLPAPRLAVLRNGEVTVHVADPGGRSAWLNGVAKLVAGPLGLRHFNRIHRRSRRDSRALSANRRMLDAMRVNVVVDEGDENEVPREGPLVVVANHSRFGLDGMAIVDALQRVRPDVKALMNAFLVGVPEIASLGIGVGDTQDERVRALREAGQWLDDGHVLVVFPAGAVSTVLENGAWVDPPWMPGAARLAQRAHAPVLPVFVDGAATPFFHQMRRIHRHSSYFLMLREFLAQEGQTVRLRFRPLVDASTVTQSRADALLQALRASVYGDFHTEVRQR